MRSFLIGLALTFLSSAQPSEAQSISGNALLRTCTSENPAQAGFCIGYLIGQIEGQNWGGFLFFQRSGIDLLAEDFNSLANTTFGHCIPPHATNEQLRDVVVKFLNENPATRHETARFLVWSAYQEAFRAIDIWRFLTCLPCTLRLAAMLSLSALEKLVVLRPFAVGKSAGCMVQAEVRNPARPSELRSRRAQR